MASFALVTNLQPQLALFKKIATLHYGSSMDLEKSFNLHLNRFKQKSMNYKVKVTFLLKMGAAS